MPIGYGIGFMIRSYLRFFKSCFLRVNYNLIGAFGAVTKGLLKGLENLEVGGRVETIQTIALLRTARILRRVLETRGDLLSLKL